MNKNSIKHYLTIQNKKYFYTIRKVKQNISVVSCVAANLEQEFLNEDIPALLNDLPNLILAEKKYKKQQSGVIRFRVSPEDKKLIEARAMRNGYLSTSSYLRELALNGHLV